MTDMNDIETRAEAYSRARDLLAREVTQLEGEITRAKRRRLPKLKKALGEAKATQAELADALSDARALFKSPKTRILHGIKCGWQKGKGKLKWTDAKSVIERIRAHFPHRATTLIKKSESPARAALQQLSTGDLKKLGITVEETGEQIVIRPVDSHVDKLVDALLTDEDIEAMEDAA
jgi:hypothetical protein